MLHVDQRRHAPKLIVQGVGISSDLRGEEVHSTELQQNVQMLRPQTSRLDCGLYVTDSESLTTLNSADFEARCRYLISRASFPFSL